MRAAVIAAILTIVAFIAGYAIWNRVSDNQAKLRREKFQRDFFNGVLPPIAEPYLAAGKAKELNFKVVELGGDTVHNLSEDGHILMLSRMGSLDHPSDYELLGPDQKPLKAFKNADRVYMTPKGDCYAFRTDSPNGIATSIEMPDGTVRPINSENQMRFNYKHGSIKALGTEAFLFIDENISKQYRPFEYYDLSLTKRTATIHEAITYIKQATSSELGDICVGFEQSLGGHNSYNLGIFKNGEVKAENIPIPHEYFRVKASKDKIAVTAGSDFFERIPFLRVAKSQYERIGVPKGAIVAEISAMNSNGEYLMDYGVPNHTRPARVQQIDNYSCLVSNGKFYLLRDIIKQFFPGSKEKLDFSIQLLDERGDLVVMGSVKSYLLLRQ